MSSDFKLAMHSRNTIDELRCLARLEPWFYALCDLRSIGATVVHAELVAEHLAREAHSEPREHIFRVAVG